MCKFYWENPWTEVVKYPEAAQHKDLFKLHFEGIYEYYVAYAICCCLLHSLKAKGDRKKLSSTRVMKMIGKASFLQSLSSVIHIFFFNDQECKIKDTIIK